jgi:hypothetical protein
MRSFFCITLVIISAQIQAQLTCKDFTNWPGGLQSGQVFEVSKSTDLKDKDIEFDKIKETEFKELLQNSTIVGKYENQDLNKKLSEYIDVATNFNQSDNIAKILTARLLSKFGESDSIVILFKRTSAEDRPMQLTFKASNENKDVQKKGSPSIGDIPIVSQDLLMNYFDVNYKNKLKKTDVGFKIKDESNDWNYTIHIFLDQFGNTLFGSMPTGVQRRYHYMVHILYLKSQQEKFSYNINVTAGDLNDVLIFYNQKTTVGSLHNLSSDSTKDSTFGFIDVGYNLFPTSDDLSFDLNVITLKEGKTQSTKLQSYTLKKTPFYFGSLNIGGVYTWVKNPSYQLVNSPVNQDKKTIKTTDNTSGVMATLLYTVYWSPINAIFRNEGVKYHSWGRSYLDDDGAFFRKIYPCFGFGLQDKVFTNVILGLNYEPMQGFGIMVGSNIRKINTFDMPNFAEGETDVTQDQFDFYQNTKWKSGWTVGLAIDLTLFNKIVGSVTTSK